MFLILFFIGFTCAQVQHGLKYNPTEKTLREVTFVKSLKFIESFNSLNDDVQLKVNQFSDWVSTLVHLAYQKFLIFFF